ncbi:hypothetical protein [Reichenbachiella sp.]|uniref:hypothetical protein n=1 Tax=Reichenbachiella sp. TaxID=2184521 RepID=UPI003B5A531F
MLTPITQEAVRNKLDQYISEKKVSNTVKIILSKPIKVIDSQIQLTITNSVEIAMIENVEVELLGYLRNELKNSSVAFNYQVSEDTEERRPYTAEEKFKAMAKKNPALLKLADEFGLDTDH